LKLNKYLKHKFNKSLTINSNQSFKSFIDDKAHMAYTQNNSINLSLAEKNHPTVNIKLINK